MTDVAPFPNRLGFRFTCQRCGSCCRRPGVIYFSPDDIQRAALFLAMTPRAFRRQYLKREERKWLLEGPADEGCPFLLEEDDHGTCSIHPARPLQCRAWPFWPEIVSSPASWRSHARRCPGMGKGTIHDREDVTVAALAIARLTGP